MTGISIPDGSVIITPLQMYQEQQEMNKTLSGVSNKIDSVVTKLDHYQEDQAARLDKIDGKDGALVKHDARITTLEKWRWKAAGVSSVVSAVGAAGGTALIMKAVLGH
jgi:DNA repair ATPase RecN